MFSVRCRSGVRGPRVRSHGDGFGEENSVAVGVGDVSLTLSAPVSCVGPTPVGALFHGPGLDGNDPLPRHISRDYSY